MTDIIPTCTVCIPHTVLKRVTYKNFSSLNRNLRSHSAPRKCPLTILKCPLSVLWRRPSYREFGYSKMTEKRPGPAPGVRLIEVSVKREFTVVEAQPRAILGSWAFSELPKCIITQ